MQTKQWWKESVVFQIYPRSFNDSNGDGIGDIKGITEKLDYLKELGIDVVWLSPVYDSPNDDNGYDIRHYQQIMDEFGSMEDFDELLEEMHKRDLKLVMDLVVNHTSDEHPWFAESRSSKENSKRDYYIWKEGKNGEEPTNWESSFSGSTWQYDKNTGEYYLHLFSKKQPDLNWENSELREDVYEMMRWWLDKGVDGFRMDVINFISKDQRFPDGEKKPGVKYASGSPYFMNGPRIHEFLHEMNNKVLQYYDVMTVGEMPGVSVEEAKLYTGEDRKELNMVFHFEHMGLGDGPGGKWDNQPWKLTDMKKIMTKWQKGLEQKGWNSLYWNNHDQPRVVSRFGNDKEYREKSAKMLATCLHMMKGTPYIYQGEEIGMTNVAFPSIEDYEDIETLNWYNEQREEFDTDPDKLMQSIYARGRDNARTPVQWDASENAGFTDGTPWLAVNPNYKQINAEQALQDPNSIFYYYQKLIQLRKQEEIVVYGDYELLFEEDEDIFAYTRTLGKETLLVVCNFTDKKVKRDYIPSFVGENKELLIANDEGRSENDDLLSVWLNPYEAFVYKFS
ncbi:glycoside hydrolase family 13 protein [Alteribacillus bidgolensis]|uniref:oligo-1,6-glucosidase n=1 Tax=Alteribacillus bidgolensis TaxID=930129 RepID=A0A1G8HL56_9BACI|nr:alpha-glucosidase [Alteribacillus bidgolensis]SDI07150.1 oligo-1,6-glucosidase [Alteribacillus bidgolensis]